MKATDLRPQHFPNGQQFSALDFDEYCKASAQLNKAAFTRYIPCVIGGLLISRVFAAMGGVIGNLLALVCIFGGLIGAALVTRPLSKHVKELANRLGITPGDLKIAQQNCKNGTFAWQGDYSAPVTATPVTAAPKRAAATAAPKITEPESTVGVFRVALLFAGLWLILIVLQCLFGPGIYFIQMPVYMLCLSVLAGSAYLMRHAKKNRAQWIALAVIAVITSTFCGAWASNYTAFSVILGAKPYLALFFTEFPFRIFLRELLLSLVPAAAFLLLLKNLCGKKEERTALALSAAAYVILSFLAIGVSSRFAIFHMTAANLLQFFASYLSDGVTLFLAYLLFAQIGKKSGQKLHLRGLGKVWAWVAMLFSAFASLGFVIVLLTEEALELPTAFMLSFIIAFVGYLLMLCHKRFGWELMLSCNGLIGLSMLLLTFNKPGYLEYFQSLLAAICMAVSLLIAGLSVRAADKKAQETAAAVTPAIPVAPAAPVANTAPVAPAASVIPTQEPVRVGKSAMAFAAQEPTPAQEEPKPTPVLKEEPKPKPEPEKPKKKRGTFYVFAAQGIAFGQPGGDMVQEKADQLREDYAPAAEMDYVLVRPYMWDGRVESSNSGGVMMSSFSFDSFEAGIRSYLKRKGIDDARIDAGIAVSQRKQLQLMNPFSGVYVIGVPVLNELAQPEEIPVIEEPVVEEPAVAEPITEEKTERMKPVGKSTIPVQEELAPAQEEPTPVQEGPVSLQEVPAPAQEEPLLEAPAYPEPEFLSREQQNQYTYEYYRAESVAAAKAFLEKKVVDLPLYYVMVRTPKGTWGRDKDGMFLESLAAFQKDLTLRECDAQTAMLPERMMDLELCARGISDNYLLSLTCGVCGGAWKDGVGYRKRTIVQCPHCGRYNLADTDNIRFQTI